MAAPKKYRGDTWRAIVRRAGHPSVSKTFETKRAAEIWQAGEEARIGLIKGGANRVSASKAWVRTLFERYLIEVVPSMIGKNEPGIVKRLLRDCYFMDTPIYKLTPAMIRDWRDERVKEVKPASVHREMNTMSGVFTHAIKEWEAPMQVNPCSLVSRFKNADKPRDGRWSKEDVDTLLKSIGWTEAMMPTTGRDYVGWSLLLAIETAMREGELCSLLVEDFYPDQAYVHLARTKNGDVRDVPLSQRAIQIFERLCQGKAKEDKIIPLKANTLCEYFGDAKNAVGLNHLVFHDSRHEATC